MTPIYPSLSEAEYNPPTTHLPTTWEVESSKKRDAWCVFCHPKKNKDFAHQIKDIFTTRWTFCLKAGQKLKRQNVKTYYERQATWESAQSQNPWSNVALWFKSVFLRWFWKSVWLNYDIWIQHPGNAMLLFLTIYYITNQPRTFQKEIHHPVCVDHFLWHLSNKKKQVVAVSRYLQKNLRGQFPSGPSRFPEMYWRRSIRAAWSFQSYAPFL